jgi:hypothetical protein
VIDELLIAGLGALQVHTPSDMHAAQSGLNRERARECFVGVPHPIVRDQLKSAEGVIAISATTSVALSQLY